MGRHQPTERSEPGTPHRQLVLPSASDRAAGAYDPLAPARIRDTDEDALRDATHDAFMALWRGTESDQALLWTAYLAAQDRYDAYVLRRS